MPLCGCIRSCRRPRVHATLLVGYPFATAVSAHELPPGPNRRRRQAKQGGFATERTARNAINIAVGDIQSGTWVDCPKTTVGEYLDQWLAGKIKLRSSTRRSYCEHIELYLKPGLGHILMGELRDTEIERLYAVMREVGQDEDESGEPLSERRQCGHRTRSRALRSGRCGRVPNPFPEW
jgi:hypothetical protein